MTPLSPDALDEDFEAVTTSAPVLKGLFGDWPDGLTRENNLIDLAWHEREFTLRRSFSWIVRDGAAAYLGCVYLFPELGLRERIRLVTWIRDMDRREERVASLNAELRPWIAKVLPSGIIATWKTNSPKDIARLGEP
ncbi:MAG: hypothetical protein AAF264_13415 [Pseudomonadota bacterium]